MKGSVRDNRDDIGDLDNLDEEDTNAQEALLQQDEQDTEWKDSAFMKKAKQHMRKMRPEDSDSEFDTEMPEGGIEFEGEEDDKANVKANVKGSVRDNRDDIGDLDNLDEEDTNAQEALLQQDEQDTEWNDSAFMKKAKQHMRKKQPEAPTGDDNVDTGEPNAPGASEEGQDIPVMSENE